MGVAYNLALATLVAISISSCAITQGTKRIEPSGGGKTSFLSSKISKSKKAEMTTKILMKNQADIKSEVEALGITVENLLGKVEENNFFTKAVIDELKILEKKISGLNHLILESNMANSHKSDLLRDQVEESFSAISGQIDEIRSLLEKKRPISAKKKIVKKKRVAKTKPVPAVIPAEEIYQIAYNNFIRGNYSQAAVEFSEYVKRFPNTELSDNSQYWIGESLERQGKRKAAVKALLRVAEKYPNSTKAPPALWRAAELQEKLGQLKTARQTLDRLRKRYPDCYEATLADKKLLELKDKK